MQRLSNSVFYPFCFRPAQSFRNKRVDNDAFNSLFLPFCFLPAQKLITVTLSISSQPLLLLTSTITPKQKGNNEFYWHGLPFCFWPAQSVYNKRGKLAVSTLLFLTGTVIQRNLPWITGVKRLCLKTRSPLLFLTKTATLKQRGCSWLPIDWSLLLFLRSQARKGSQQREENSLRFRTRLPFRSWPRDTAMSPSPFVSERRPTCSVNSVDGQTGRRLFRLMRKQFDRHNFMATWPGSSLAWSSERSTGFDPANLHVLLSLLVVVRFQNKRG